MNAGQLWMIWKPTSSQGLVSVDAVARIDVG